MTLGRSWPRLLKSPDPVPSDGPEPPAPGDPEPPVPGDPETTDEPGVRHAPPDPVDLPTDAIRIGRTGDPPPGVTAPGVWLRPAAVALDGTTAGAFHVAAASMIGTGHLGSGQPRQDAYAFMAGRAGRVYVAVADGLGSRPSAQLGAHLFGESVLREAARREEDDTDGDRPPSAADLLDAASRRIAEVAGFYGLDERDVACVGAVAVLSPDGGDLARIGDVSAFVRDDDGFEEAFPAESGFVNVVGASMPGHARDDVEVAAIGPVGTLVVGTDGLANDLRNSSVLRRWLADRWAVPQLAFAIGDTLRYRRQGSHDDRTAVVVWRTPADPEPGDDQR